LLGDGGKGMEIVYGEGKIFWIGLTRTAKAEQKSLVLARKNRQTKLVRTSFICTL
jgi:hypothetical protein